MADYKSDIEIAQEASMLPIEEVAQKAGIDWATCEPYGHYKAKVDIHSYKDAPMKAKLVLPAVSVLFAPVYIAEDADGRIREETENLCREHGVPVVSVDTMEHLGHACGIQVGAAVAALIKAQ